MNRLIVGGLAAIAIGLLTGTVNAETLRTALHGQTGIDAFTPTAEPIEAALGIDAQIVEYPAPDTRCIHGTNLTHEIASDCSR